MSTESIVRTHHDMAGSPQAVATSDWRKSLPALNDGRVTIRDLRMSDAPSLHAMLATHDVARFISPPPTTVEGFERFIAWTHRRRDEGAYVCFGIVPQGCEHAVGIIQVRQLDPGWSVAEWGFAIGTPFWGTGVFTGAARLVIDFVFGAMTVHRLEARAAVRNGRGSGALAKLGAVREALLRKSFLRDGEVLDQALWAIVREDWMQSKAVWSHRVH
jgi:[ribosomal protein S5]-alanine N-acetyltransferase